MSELNVQQGEDMGAHKLVMGEAVNLATEQYLTFFLDGEEYGVNILSVQEIRGWEQPTQLPNAPKHVKGVVNLRGTIVPITDLRERFGLDKKEYGPITVVIVLTFMDEDDKEKVVGIIVDAVSDVYDIMPKDVKPSPGMDQKLDGAFVKGLVNIDERMLILLDINKLLKNDVISDELVEE